MLGSLPGPAVHSEVQHTSGFTFFALTMGRAIANTTHSHDGRPVPAFAALSARQSSPLRARAFLFASFPQLARALLFSSVVSSARQSFPLRARAPSDRLPLPTRASFARRASLRSPKHPFAKVPLCSPKRAERLLLARAFLNSPELSSSRLCFPLRATASLCPPELPSARHCSL